VVVPQINAIYVRVAATNPAQASTIDAWTAFGGSTFDQSLHSDVEHLSPTGAQLLANLVVAAVG
jgi:lysophospholipase L1-like esterase